MINRHLHRRSVLRAGLALGAAGLIAPARAHEFFSSSLTILHPWTRATAAGATSAIVSMRFVDVVRTDHLIGAETPVAAGAELGGVGGVGTDAPFDFLIREGQNAELGETGVFLRLLRLNHPLLLGREYPLTLHFEKGGPIQAALLIDFPASG